MDSGPLCLRMVAKFYGKTYSLQTLRSKAFVTRSGVLMHAIVHQLQSLNGIAGNNPEKMQRPKVRYGVKESIMEIVERSMNQIVCHHHNKRIFF
jgi:ABC-type bacteriocin/lantibiotic exporter with double-glycine peptidase domain